MLIQYYQSIAPVSHSYIYPMIIMKKKAHIIKKHKRSPPFLDRTSTHGKRKTTSTSKTINKIAVK